jgi:hypothetical protein
VITVGIYIRIMPGVNVRLTPHGVRWGLGPRARRGRQGRKKIMRKIAITAAAAVLAALLSACGGGKSAVPAWCKAVVRDIEATAATAPNPDPGAAFQDQMTFEHNTDGAPAYVAKLGNDPMRLSEIEVSNGVTEAATATGRAIITSDLKPIAAACRVPLKRLTYAMITSWQ